MHILKRLKQLIHKDTLTQPEVSETSSVPDNIQMYQASRKLPVGTPPCLAPWTSLSFNIDGTVSICCLNRKATTNVEGKTISEIWDSEPFQELRREVQSHNLHHDCEICLQQIQVNNFQGVKALDYDKFYPVNPDYPKVMEFCLENTCNLACEMCSSVFSSTIRKNRNLPRQKSFYGESFVDDLEAYIPHLKEAIFAGGEPFLIPLYFRIWEKMIALNPDIIIGVVTNATMLNDRIKALLEKGNFRINASIDSFDAETYESIRKNAKFTEVMENLEWFKEYSIRKGFVVNIPMCPLTTNWKTIPDAVRFANHHLIAVNFVHVEKPISLALLHQSYEYLEQVISYFAEQTFSDSSSIAKQNIDKFYGLMESIKSWQKGKKPQSVTVKGDLNEAIERWTQKVLNSDELPDPIEKQEVINQVKAALDLIPDENKTDFVELLTSFSANRVHHFVKGRSTKEVAVTFQDFMGK